MLHRGRPAVRQQRTQAVVRWELNWPRWTSIDPRLDEQIAELNLALADREVAQGLEATLARDLAHARRMDPAGWQARGLPARLREWLAMPLEPLL